MPPRLYYRAQLLLCEPGYWLWLVRRVCRLSWLHYYQLLPLQRNSSGLSHNDVHVQPVGYCETHCRVILSIGLRQLERTVENPRGSGPMLAFARRCHSILVHLYIFVILWFTLILVLLFWVSYFICFVFIMLWRGVEPDTWIVWYPLWANLNTVQRRVFTTYKLIFWYGFIDGSFYGSWCVICLCIN